MAKSALPLGTRDKTTHFLNVDLDIFSRSRLAPLVAACGEKVSVLYEGREGSRYSAHLELSGYTENADATLRGLCGVIRELPVSARRHWDRAIKRIFDIGIEAARKDRRFEIEIRPETVKEVASLNARIVVTVYAPILVPGLPKR